MTVTHILYNAQCPICRAEIAHYQARAERAQAPLRFEDLNDCDLSAWNLTPDAARRRLHARLPDGTLVSGVPAFAAIWRALPGFGWAARLVGLPLIRPIASFMYNRIAAPWLYHRQRRLEARSLAAERSHP